MRNQIIFLFLLGWVLALITLNFQIPASNQSHSLQSPKAMIITSNSFKNEEFIPTQHTCDGLDFSPQLEWDEVPASTKSFAILCNDPDAPSGNWIHWVVANIPAQVRHLDEHYLVSRHPEMGAVAGINDFRLYEYRGPCPPGGIHRYYFHVYALDTLLNARKGISAEELKKMMYGHILAERVLMGKYSRK